MTTETMSYHHSLSTTKLLNQTLGVSLDNAAARWPDREAFVVRDQGARLTFAALRQQADRLAGGLIALGLKPGDRVALWSPNRFEWVVSQYATAKAGLILVNVNPGYRVAELEYALNKVECRAIIAADYFKTSHYIGMLRELAPELDHCEPGQLKSARLPHLAIAIHMSDADEPGFYTLNDAIRMDGPAAQARLAELAGLLQPDDPINIQFTSGTTGSPKAATLTHHGLVNNGLLFAEGAGMTEGTRFCNPLPLFHVGGMVCGSIAGVMTGATIVYLGEAFDPLAALEAVRAERCDALGGVPTMFVAILNHPSFKQYDVGTLRLGFIGGSPCPADVMRRIMGELHIGDITIIYGMTELSGSSVQTARDDTLERRVTTIGRVQPHMEVKIVDPDGHVVPCGIQGEICFRGHMVMRGYWNGEAQTRETIDPARWLHSGDLGTMDADGYIAVTGRSKDMVIRGGENIYPREIEEFLFGHPAVADVQVFGVPDAKYGEELCAWIRLRPGMDATEADIRDFCRDRITHFKIPRHVRFVDAFPMTVTGKVQKFVMRKAMAEELTAGAA